MTWLQRPLVSSANEGTIELQRAVRHDVGRLAGALDDAATRELRGMRRNLLAVRLELDATISAALRAATGEIAVDARARAPYRTGRLAASIDAEAGLRLRSSVGSDLIYAGVIEHGAVLHPHPHGRPVVIKPHRFLARALETHEDRATDAIHDAVDRLLRKHGLS
jgi:hypothetical protein